MYIYRLTPAIKQAMIAKEKQFAKRKKQSCFNHGVKKCLKFPPSLFCLFSNVLNNNNTNNNMYIIYSVNDTTICAKRTTTTTINCTAQLPIWQ